MKINQIYSVLNDINEQYWGNCIEKAVAFGFVYYITDIFYTRADCREGVERTVQLGRDDSGKGSLAHTWRAPKDER